MKRVALSIIFILLSTASVIAAGGIIPPYTDLSKIVMREDAEIPQSVNTAVWSTINDWIQGVGSPGIINGGNLSYDQTSCFCRINFNEPHDALGLPTVSKKYGCLYFAPVQVGSPAFVGGIRHVFYRYEK